jgi:flagellar motor protein MotB
MLLMVAGLVLTTSLTGGCSNKLKSENASLTEEVNSLRSQLADRNKALEDCNNDVRAKDQQLATLRRDMEAGGKNGTGSLGNTGFEGIEGVNATASGGQVTASVESDLLFDSGKTTLKANAKKSLDQVARVLNSQYGGQTIRVVGYTDTDPIKKSGFKSNYHLGFDRAYSVREYLISKGVDSKRLSLASFGPDAPKGTKAQSRRVEIVVVLAG